MRDSDPPKCPRCLGAGNMRRTGDERRAGSEDDDVDSIAKVFYRCECCRVRWVDHMDGIPLRMAGVAKKRH